MPSIEYVATFTALLVAAILSGTIGVSVVRRSFKDARSAQVWVRGTVPSAQNPTDAGLDLRRICDGAGPVILRPGEHTVIPTGTSMAIPEDMVGFVCPRSGLAAKHRVTVLNSPGVIDAGYRGDIGVALINHGDTDFVIVENDRIAQLVLMHRSMVQLAPTPTLPNGDGRGAGGFGSTGTA